jgi:Ca2+-binding RTX toxin-like protein
VRRFVFLMTTMALVLVGGVALAVTRIGTDGPDTSRGTRNNDDLVGKGGNEQRPLGGDKNQVGGPGNDGVQSGSGADNVLGGSGNDAFFVDNGPATRDVVTCGSGYDRAVASDCERVSRGPNAAQQLDLELEEEGFFDKLFGGLAPFPDV